MHRPRKQKGNENCACFVIEVEKIIFNLLGAISDASVPNRTYLDSIIVPDLGWENFEYHCISLGGHHIPRVLDNLVKK